jgi:signal transduction histidine kinase
MGLFIAKQISEEHFGGKLALDSRKKHTSFVVTLPRG